MTDILCPICTDNFLETTEGCVSTSCGHLYHRQCLLNWFEKKNTCPSCRTEEPQLIDLFPETSEYRQTAINLVFEKYNVALNTLKQSTEQDEPTAVDANHTISELLSAFDNQDYLPPQTVTDCTKNLLNIHASITEMKKTVRKNKKIMDIFVTDTRLLKEKLRSAINKKKEMRKFIIRQQTHITMLKRLIKKAKRPKIIQVSDSD